MGAPEILFEAMLKARRAVSTGGREHFMLNFAEAIRQFKNSWIYTNPTSLRYDSCEATGSYLFVFSKNLHVTNIALPELLSLARIFTTRRSNHAVLKLNFFSNEEYTRYLTNNLTALYPVTPIFSQEEFESTARQIAKIFSEQHSSVISDTIIVDAYFTTALMHIPLSLATDIRSIVFESGYIHSAGHSLYIRRVEKAKQSELEERIRLFLQHSGATPPIFVTPYADEYFAPWEKQNSATSIRNGLDGIRIELRKHYLEGQALRDYLNGLGERIPELRVAPGLKHYNSEREDSRANAEWTIWLISDTRHVLTEERITTRGRDHYLMVYAQKYHNANQFVLFKERKLAWTAPITLPHTLSTSMVNIARSGFAQNERPIIVDPFCGTGTTLIDAAVRVPNAVILGLDKNPLMPRLVEDNLEFFGKDREEIARLHEQYTTLAQRIDRVVNGRPNIEVRPVFQLIEESKTLKLDALATKDVKSASDFELVFEACMAELRAATQNQATLLAHGSDKIIDDGFGDEMTALLAGSRLDWSRRTLFFATWRAIANARHSIRGDADLYPVIQREYETIARELNDYLQSLAQREIGSTGKFSFRQGTYSLASIVAPAIMAQFKHRKLEQREIPNDLQSLQSQQIQTIVVQDSTEALSHFDRQVDLIITDPPYGFNTHEFGLVDLQELYGRFVAAAVKALKTKGQFVLVVPAFARNGKQVPYFLTEGALIRQIVGAANAAGRDVLNVIHTVPARKAMYLPPFYWNSPSALSRRILWFTLE